MNATRSLRVVASRAGTLGHPPGRFGPDDCYPVAVWLPILGPAAFVFWRHLARQLAHHPDGVTTSLAALAVDLGLGSPHGSQSAVHRTVRRLERFGLLRWVGDDCLVLSAHLPFVSPAQLARLAPSVQARHQALRDGASSQAR